MTGYSDQSNAPATGWRDSFRTVSIVGVGLIGGSFALAIRRAGFQGEILGVSSAGTIEEALALGVIDRGMPLEEAAAASDLVYLANPIQRILDSFPRIAASIRPGTLVTDAGSTKSVIVSEAAKHFSHGMFLGGHPMAGKAARGVSAAEAELLSGRTYVLTPDAGTVADIQSYRCFQSLLEDIGARIVVMDARTHDKVVAVTSHLPQLISTILAETVLNEIPDIEYLSVSGRGLADMTRLAGSSYDVWSDILRTNRQAISDVLDEYLRTLQLTRDQFGEGSLRDLFERAATVPSRLTAFRQII
ncbi:MAG: prephenate dehydrogenase/arogenate dehydrogenase family protein [Bryobacterales bacterium]|nr:prephenate dehydrogenase/arogenate dehydrogenase family protein [Bryobacterales bacterium]